MLSSQAATWYRSMVPMIPKIRIDDYSGDNDWEEQCNLFQAQWGMKSRLRLAAAQALYSPELIGEFFDSFPLPSAMDYLGTAFTIGRGEDVFEIALSLLTEVSEPEKRRFPGTVGESLGLECHTANGIYVMTESGWQPKATPGEGG